MVTCSKCPNRLRKGDTHDSCPLHSSCYDGTSFDPRQCEKCEALFQSAKDNNTDAISCWNAQFRCLVSAIDENVLHPDAHDWCLPEVEAGGNDSVTAKVTHPQHDSLMDMMNKMYDEMRSTNSRVRALENDRNHRQEESDNHDSSEQDTDQEGESEYHSEMEQEQEEEMPSMIGESFPLPSQVNVFPDSIELPNSTISIGE